MTIVANRDCAMTRLDPAVVILRHDVAVCAGGWIVGQVGRALRIDKSISSYADCQADGCCEQRSFGSAQLHGLMVSYFLSIRGIIAVVWESNHCRYAASSVFRSYRLSPADDASARPTWSAIRLVLRTSVEI